MLHHSPSLVRRNIRLRQRAAPKPLIIPFFTRGDVDLRRDEVFSPQTDNPGLPSMSMSPVQFLAVPEMLRALEVDSDSDLEATQRSSSGPSVGPEESCSDLSETLSRRLSCLTDMSNYLDTSQSCDGADDVAVNHATYRSLTRESTSETDSYGWETEYDRKEDCRNADLARRRRGLGCRKSTSAQERLLRRVLSLSEE
ncbi:hypothetical protein GGS20DRAFT_363152 [Poronia punctata]|nr:hypothetical protein GGS20DRAFT_363152 [Poronia punctata]